MTSRLSPLLHLGRVVVLGGVGFALVSAGAGAFALRFAEFLPVGLPDLDRLAFACLGLVTLAVAGLAGALSTCWSADAGHVRPLEVAAAPVGPVLVTAARQIGLPPAAFPPRYVAGQFVIVVLGAVVSAAMARRPVASAAVIPLLTLALVLPLVLWGAFSAADLPRLPREAQTPGVLGAVVDAAVLAFGAAGLISSMAGALAGRAVRLQRRVAVLSGLCGCLAAMGVLPLVAVLYGTGLRVPPVVAAAATAGALLGALLSLAVPSGARTLQDGVVRVRGAGARRAEGGGRA